MRIVYVIIIVTALLSSPILAQQTSIFDFLEPEVQQDIFKGEQFVEEVMYAHHALQIFAQAVQEYISEVRPEDNINPSCIQGLTELQNTATARANSPQIDNSRIEALKSDRDEIRKLHAKADKTLREQLAGKLCGTSYVTTKAKLKNKAENLAGQAERDGSAVQSNRRVLTNLNRLTVTLFDTCDKQNGGVPIEFSQALTRVDK